jgi:hypothetical protein
MILTFFQQDVSAIRNETHSDCHSEQSEESSNLQFRFL